MNFETTSKVNHQESGQPQNNDGAARISRRDFLKFLRASAATLGLTACGVKASPEETQTPTPTEASGSTVIVVPTETIEQVEVIPSQLLEKLSDIYECRDKTPPIALEETLKSIHESGDMIGYISYPSGLYFEATGNLKEFENIRNNPSSNVSEATKFITTQIQRWGEKPTPSGNSKFVGFDTDEEKTYQQFILDAMQAVWGSDKYDWVIGMAELKRDFFGGGWSSPGNVILGCSSFSSPDERRLAANISLHEIVVGHGMDPLAGSGYRSVDIRDAVTHRKEWFSVSKSAAKFLSAVGGPEHDRQEHYDFAKNNLSNGSLDRLEADPAYNTLSNVGEKILARDDEYFSDIEESEIKLVDEEINNLGNLGVDDRHKKAALALAIHKKLQQQNTESISNGKLVNALNSVLRREVRQEHEMVAEVMRHILTMDSPPSAEVESEFKELESFVQFVLNFYESGKSLSQARADLKSVMDSYIV